MHCSLQVKQAMGNDMHGVNLFPLQITTRMISTHSTFALPLCL